MSSAIISLCLVILQRRSVPHSVSDYANKPLPRLLCALISLLESFCLVSEQELRRVILEVQAHGLLGWPHSYLTVS